MPEGDLSNTEKAAVILMSLGKDQASEVMKHLSEAEVKKLSRAFMSVQEVNRETQQNIAGEFHKMLRSVDAVVVDGKEFAKDVIAGAFGNQASDSLMEYVTGSKKEPLGTLLADIPTNLVDAFISTEHPQTVAFLLTKLAPEISATMLQKMPEEIQTDVLVRIANLQNVKSDVIDEVREVLKSQLRGVSLREEEGLGGAKAAASILNFVERTAEERMVAEIEEKHPELAEEIRNLMFTFEDVGKLDDRAVQTVLKEVPREQLVLAIKRASDTLRQLFFRNISQRAAQMLQEDLETLGPTKLKDVQKAQQGIVDIVRRLEAEGKIAIGGGGDDVLV